MKKSIFLFLLVALTSCATVNKPTIWLQKNLSTGQLQVKNAAADNTSWLDLQSKIEDFDYEDGFIYQLKVQKNKILQNQSTYNYSLVKILKKIENKSTMLANNWELRNIADENGNLTSVTDVKRSYPTIRFDLKKMQFSGMDGCNLIFGVIKTHDNQIIINKKGATKKACMGTILPNKFNNALASTKFYKIKNNTLQLLNTNQKVLLEFVTVD